MMMDTTTGEGANIFRVKEAKGGRIGYQTGGVTEQRTLPPEFVEAAQKTFLTDLSRQAGIPTITTAVQQQPGETAQQFANRQAQAQQFNITRAGMAELAPQVAAQDPLQAAAYQQAVDPTKGLGSNAMKLQWGDDEKDLSARVLPTCFTMMSISNLMNLVNSFQHS